MQELVFSETTITKEDFVNSFNEQVVQKKPFLCVIDSHLSRFHLFSEPETIDFLRFEFGASSRVRRNVHQDLITYESNSQDHLRFKEAFYKLQKEVNLGNSYLANLTMDFQIQSSNSFEELFEWSYAPYKLLVRDFFLVYSPEPFVEFEGGRVRTFPMKGTLLKTERIAYRRYWMMSRRMQNMRRWSIYFEMI